MEPINTKAMNKKQVEVKRAVKKFKEAVDSLPVDEKIKGELHQIVELQSDNFRKAIHDAGLLPVDKKEDKSQLEMAFRDDETAQQAADDVFGA